MLPSIYSENLFDDFFSDPFDMVMPRSLNALYGKHGKNLMKTDVRETEDTYELDIDLPGFKKDEVNLELKDGYLTIQAAKGLDKEEPEKKGKYIRQERYAGACSRGIFFCEGTLKMRTKASQSSPSADGEKLEIRVFRGHAHRKTHRSDRKCASRASACGGLKPSRRNACISSDPAGVSPAGYFYARIAESKCCAYAGRR